MARTRKRTRATKKRSRITLSVKTSVVREIWAVFYLGLAVITFLSLQKSFGLPGEVLMNSFPALKPMLGWGVYVLPVVFLAISLLFFFSKKIAFALSRILGILCLLVAVLSVFHLSVPAENLLEVAKLGEYGGYVGFVTNFLFREFLQIGSIGAGVIFFMLFLVGALLTFEISIGAFLAFLKPDLKIVRRPANVSSEDEEDDGGKAQIKKEKNVDKDRILQEIDEMDEEEFNSKHSRPGEITIKRAQIAATKSSEPVTKTIRVEEAEEQPTKAVTNTSTEEDYVWVPPSLDLLSPPVPEVGVDDVFLKDNAEKISDKLAQFGLDVSMHEVHVGPTVIQYTLRPDEGIKLSKITTLKNDLALALAAKAIRIEAPIPGKSLVGIEVPNDHRTLVHLREILESKEFQEIDSNLRFPLGRDVSGKPMCGDLASMPHLLIAGATGSGKSVGMNTFLIALLYQNSPKDLKLIMVDPKRVELTGYNGIPHLLAPVITDPEKAAIALRWAVVEMNRRYQLFAEKGHRNIVEYNSCQEDHGESADTAVESFETKAEDATEKKAGHEKMPNIIIVIDELADLMMAAGKEVEASICRIAQMARAVGMHLVLATQRPSVDVITGLIKANVPARIAFAVSSSIDSRTILDGVGAEDLLGKGDMLYLPSGMGKPVRIQGIYVSPKEIERVTNHVKVHGQAPHYIDEITSPKLAQEKVHGIPESSFADADDDTLYREAIRVVIESRKASASLLQRRLKLGYARAARMLDQMEENGIIGPVNGAKAREIFVNTLEEV